MAQKKTRLPEVDHNQQNTSPDIIILPDTKNTVFVSKHWLKLFQFDTYLYNQRYKIVRKQEELQLAQLWNATIKRTAQDGNCIVKSFLSDLEIPISTQTILFLRKQLNSYLVRNNPSFAMRYNDTGTFLEDKVLLNEDHYWAYCQIYKKNVCVLEYESTFDDFSLKIWFDKKFKQSVYLLYHQIPNTQSDAGHIDRIIMPVHSLQLSELNLNRGFNYISGQRNHVEICSELKDFDSKHNLPHILLDHSQVYDKFGNVLGDKLIECGLFPIKNLLWMAKQENLCSTNFKNTDLNSAVAMICALMETYEQ
eukprot:462303_1